MCCQSVIVMHGQDLEHLRWDIPPKCYIVQTALWLSEQQRYACVCLCVLVRLCVSAVPGCFIIQSQIAQTQTDEWVGFSLSLPLSLTLLRYLTLRPPTLAENLTAALQLAVKCVISKGERRQWFILLVLIQGLSLLWTWSTNPSLRCCYVVVVVVRLPWRWAVSRSEPRIRLRRV